MLDNIYQIAVVKEIAVRRKMEKKIILLKNWNVVESKKYFVKDSFLRQKHFN